MFDGLSDKLQGVFSKLAGRKTLTEENLSDAVREVRMALLEADVHYGVTKTFVKRVKEQALGIEVTKSVSPTQQFIKIVHDELAALMGEGEATLSLEGKPSVILMCGLQGAGKTTHCAKLARYLLKQHPHKSALLVACDLQRPAAIDQLHTLGKQAEVPVFSLDGEKNPVKVAKAAYKHANKEKIDFVIFDTAGRLHIDEPLMDELQQLKKLLSPDEILFVANATTGQDAVNSAKTMHEKVGITGSILTMLDGNTRGGAAISILEVTGSPLKFEGIGEKLDDIQLFNASSMADRILGMGDTINLVKKAQEVMSEEESKELEQKLRSATFTYDDFLKQFKKMEKLGSMKGLLKMLPGGGKLAALDGIESQFSGHKAIIQSMTKKERNGEVFFDMNRRRRVAKGSGTTVNEINQLAKSFKQAKEMFNTKNQKKFANLVKNHGDLPEGLADLAGGK